MKMMRYIMLLTAMAILLSGCVVVHSEKHTAVNAQADAMASAARP